MRLWELVPCWGQPVGEQPPPPPSSPPFKEETRVLMGPASSPSDTRAGGERHGRRKQRSSVVWRPSLGAICENTATSVASPRPQQRALGRQKESAAWKSRPTRLTRGPPSERERYGYTGVPSMVPAFTPTAFLF